MQGLQDRIYQEFPQYTRQTHQVKSVERELSQIAEELTTLEMSVAELCGGLQPIRSVSPESGEKDCIEPSADCPLATQLKSQVVRIVKINRLVRKTLSELEL